MNKLTISLALFLSPFYLISASFAQEVPVPKGAGREEIVENELQKATQWAQREALEQTQENFLKKDKQIGNEINEISGVHEKDEFMGVMSDDHLQDRAPAMSGEDVSQEMKKKFEDDLEQDIGENTPNEYDHHYLKEVKQAAELKKNDQLKVSSKIQDDTDLALEESYKEFRQSQHHFELGTEAYFYKYTEVIGVKLDGYKGGLVGAYQYKLLNDEQLSFFRFEGRTSYGKVDYEGSGTWGGIPDWNFETRGLLGLEVQLLENLSITPFGGLGYRYLYNDLSKYPASIVDGTQYLSGYDRESKYIYIPLGLEAKTKLTRQWDLAVKGEFDIFVWGKQISHLEDMKDENNVNAGYDKLENTQEKGLGWRASARLSREAGRFDIFVEPFIRYWHIEDSEVSFVTASGSLICQGNLCAAGLEPDNKTWEYGVNFGAKF